MGRQDKEKPGNFPDWFGLESYSVVFLLTASQASVTTHPNMASSNKPRRAPGITTITFPIDEDKKEALKKRAQKTPAQLAVADLCRLAIEYQEKRGWKEIPEARIE